ncbi:MAG TPA: Hpt domain-containing protein, partial [Steroidobacteraceae bacterium]|nr:Hpt domain-containing protein [Steroidobacteraceae bacterium]
VTLSQERMERLADAIVSVEYYMETLQAGRADPWYMLDNAERCLAALEEATSVVELPPDIDQAAEGATVLLETTPREPGVHEHERTQVIGAPAAVPEPAAAVVLPPVLAPSEDKADPEFVELFIEEARDEAMRIAELFPQWEENPQDADALVQIRRAFHTLKGSGRMVGALRIGEFSWAVENLLNRVISRTLERSPAILALVRDAVQAVPELIEQIETSRDTSCDVAALIGRAHELAGGPPATAAPRPVAASEPRVQAPSAPQPSREPVASELAAADTAMDPALHDIYSKETAGHLQTSREFLAACERSAPPFHVTDALYRSCHTLSGTAKTAGARQGIKIAEPLNHYVRKLYDNGMGLAPAGLALLQDAVAAIEDVVAHIDQDTGYFRSHERLIARIRDLEAGLDAQLAELAAAAESTIAGAVPGFDTSMLEVLTPELTREIEAREATETAEAPGEEAATEEPISEITEEPAAEALSADVEASESTDETESAEEVGRPEGSVEGLIIETEAWASTYEPPTLDDWLRS